MNVGVLDKGRPAEPEKTSRPSSEGGWLARLFGALPNFLGPVVLIAELRFQPSDVFQGICITALVAGVIVASAFLLGRHPSDRRLMPAVSLVGIVSASAIVGATAVDAWAGHPPATACKSWANFSSPTPGQEVNPTTKINGRVSLCGGDSLWVVTRSSDGEYVSRMRQPVSPDDTGNWRDPQRAVFGKNPPARFTYCLMVTDAAMTDKWINAFNLYDQGETLSLASVQHPQKCLAEVSVRAAPQ
jgi:hypothetical protein